MVRSARARPKGRRSYSAPQDLDATALRLDSTGPRQGRFSRPKSFQDLNLAHRLEAGAVPWGAVTVIHCFTMAYGSREWWRRREPDPMLSMVATRRRADRRSGASAPWARQTPLNSSIPAIRLRTSGVIWMVSVRSLYSARSLTATTSPCATR